METTLQKYKRALKHANAVEKLQCHIGQIEFKIKENSFTDMNDVWVDYFLGEL